MKLTSFYPTKFGNWVVKLSYVKDYNSFIIIATNFETHEFLIRRFDSELEVVNYVSFLGEQYE